MDDQEVALPGRRSVASQTGQSGGILHTCGLDIAGTAWCWGYDGQGQVGDGDDGQGDEYSPVAVAGGHTFTTLTAGYRYTCGVDPAGAAWGWGACNFISLGFSPVAVAGGHTFTTLTASNNHTCGVDTTWRAWCWGWNYLGALGVGRDVAFENSPVAVAGGHTFTTLTAGGTHTCGVDNAGKAWCWGSDALGQVGDGDEYAH